MGKQIGEYTVNDGKGLLDNVGLIDTLIIDCQEAVHAMTEGSYIRWCNIMVSMVQKLTNLKKGVQTDIESRDKAISDLTGKIEILKGCDG